MARVASSNAARAIVDSDHHLIVLRDMTERAELRTDPATPARESASYEKDRRATSGASELASTKEALAAKTELLEAVLRHAPIGILIAEAPTGSLVSMNQAFERIWKGTGPETPNVDAYAGWRLRNADGSRRAPHDTQMARALNH